MAVELRLDDNPETLYALLKEETDEVLTDIDGGDFGRPLTPEGIGAWWRVGLPELKTRAGSAIEEHARFTVFAEGTCVGHVEMLLSRLEHIEDPVPLTKRNLTVGQLVGSLMIVYVAAGHRNKGIGSEMVRQAVQHGVAKGAVVRVLCALRNEPATRFYHRAGLRDTVGLLTKQGVEYALLSTKMPEVRP
eukprot:TRINITY_DN1172_c0_g2_i1.p1 TRINITY_DN1172_c0_g2~~TRINITY_DN1172_c0_g2_i1.p1  ORF type:complete len:190 (+),score=37.62 TRINITY_DN1172_c0_g2_i1:162-731(+)